MVGLFCKLKKLPTFVVVFFVLFFGSVQSASAVNTGTYTSQIKDMGANVSLTTLTWTANTPGGTSITMKVRAGNTTDLSDATQWASISNGGSLSALSGYRFVQYEATLSSNNDSIVPELNDVNIGYTLYETATSYLVSSPYDTGDSSNVIGGVSWVDGTAPAESASTTFYIRTGATSEELLAASWTEFKYTTSGCSKSASTTTCTVSSIPDLMKDKIGDRWIQYRIGFQSNGAYTPVVESVNIVYVINAPPEVKNVTASQSDDGTVSISYEIRSVDTDTDTNSEGVLTPSFQYYSASGSCSTGCSLNSLSAEATTTKAVDDENWTTYSAVWTPRNDFPDVYDTTAYIKVVVDDKQAVNNIATATSTPFTLDTTPPTASIRVDASVTPATIYISSSDQSTPMMMMLQPATLDGAAYESYAATKEIDLTGQSAVYAKLKDGKNNETEMLSVVIPEKPASFMVQDITNLKSELSDYRLFVAWKKVSAPAQGAFGGYKVYRSLDGTNWSQIGENIPSINTNYYTDQELSSDVLYYYKVVSTDSLGNVSFATDPISARANGIQDAGEGGGGNAAAPTISNVTASEINASSVLITWDTDVLSNSVLSFSSTEGDFSTVITVSSMVDNTSSIGSHQVMLSGLNPNTTYYYKVGSQNSAGSLTEDANGGAGYTFTTTDGPLISGPTASSVSNNKATIRWETNVEANSFVFFSTSTSFAVASTAQDLNMATSHTVELTNLTPLTKYYFYVRSVNGAGTGEDKNVVSGVPQFYSFYTTNDTAAARFTNFVVKTSTSTADISWLTSEDTDSQVEYGETVSYGSNSDLDSILTKKHFITISGLSPATTYHFRAKGTDGDGNPGVSSDQTFTTLSNEDAIAPVIADVVTSSVTLNSAIITWNTNKNANSSVNYGTSESLGTLEGDLDSMSTSHSVTLNGLLGNTTYYFKVISADTFGNKSTSEIYSFTTVADTTAPVVNNVTKLVNQTAAFINWDTDEMASGRVDYGTSLSYGSISAVTSTYATTHSILLSSLTPSTTYYYRIITTDPSGNVTTIGDNDSNYSFTTDATPDTTLPVISNLQVGSIALDRASISWDTDKNTNATVEFGSTEQYGSIAGSLYDFSTTSHRVTINDLRGNTTYYFRVNSIDRSGNAASSTGQFTTVPDTAAPVIFNTSTLASDTAAFVNWSTDELSTSEVFYGTSTDNLWMDVRVTSTFNTNHSLPVTGLAPSTTYFFNIISVDPSFNTSSAGPYNFSTPAFGTSFVTTTVIIDNTEQKDIVAPSVTNVSVYDISSYGATISWYTDEQASSLVSYGGSKLSSLAGNDEARETSHIVTLVNLKAGTTYRFKAKSYDRNGNMGASPETEFTTLNIDGTEAVPNESTPDEESEKNIVLMQVRKASKVLVAQILEALVDNPFLKDVSDSVIEKALADISSQVVNAPTIVGLRPQVEVVGTTAFIRWSTDKKSTGVVSFAKETDYKAGDVFPYTTSMVDSTEMSSIHSIELTNLEPATRYHFQVSSKGEIGPEAKSKDYTFVTEDVLPEITDIKVTDLSSNEAVVSWKTNVPTASTLEYTNLKTQKTLTAGDPALLLTHTFTLKNLESGATFNLIIKAKNESGKEGSSSIIRFSTVADTQAPLIKNLSANSTLYPGQNSKVQTIISWETDELAVAQVFYQEGVSDQGQVQSTTIDGSLTRKHIVVLTSFKPGTVYKYWIETTDQTGNKAKSEAFTMLTPIEKQTIIDIINNNFQQVFGWTKNINK